VFLVCVFLLVSSIFIFAFQAGAGASIAQLQINNVPSFSGQLCCSYFAPDGTLFAGDNDFNLYRSDDNGGSFRLIYHFPSQPNPASSVNGYVWDIFVDSHSTVFVSIPGTNRLYRSSNFGSSFSEVLNTGGSQNDGFYIALTEDSSGNLYAATYCNSVYPNNPAVLKSSNGGVTWSVLQTFACVHLHTVKYNPADGYLYVATGEWGLGYNNGDCERIFRSKDLGQTWTAVIQRPVDMAAEGDTVYLSMMFDGRWVYLGTDQAFKPNWIDRFYDDGSDSASTLQTVYSFPSDCNFPVVSAVWLDDVMLFSSTAEFSDGTARVVASEDGVNWQIIKSHSTSASLHHTNILTSNPQGIVFGSNGPGETFSISENTPPTPTATVTPTPTPTSTPTPGYLFTADFESGSFSEYTATGGDGSHSQSVETANPYKGSYDAKFTAGADSEGWAYQSVSSSAITYYRQLVKIGTLPTSGNYICLGSVQSTSSQNTVDPFIYNFNGQYYWGAVSVINGNMYWDRQSSASNPTAGTYYTVEVCRDVTNHKTSLWVDGNLKLEVTRQHSGNSNLIFSGISWADSPTTVYVDCVRAKTSYIGLESTPTPTPTPTPPPAGAPLTTALQVNANVTVTAINFDRPSSTLYLSIVKSGTNYMQAMISKTSLPSLSTFKVYVNNVQTTYSNSDNGTYWTITIKST